jgi:ribosomal protein S18 acetylase RimI-like enzyme
MSITAISNTSWPGILKVQKQAYTGLAPEALDVLKSKWMASPTTCFVFHSQDEEVAGYVLSHAWNSFVPPKLFEALPNIPSGDILYLHDLAVSSTARGLGIGGQLSNKLLASAKAHSFKYVFLVAVQASQSYWCKLGFREIEDATICPSYGHDATLMRLYVV